MFTTAGLRRSTTSAKLMSGPAAAEAPFGAGLTLFTGPAATDDWLLPPPAKIAPTRKATTAVSARLTNVKRRMSGIFHYKSQKRLLIQRFDAELPCLLQ